MHSNNETGVIQPIKEIAEIASEYNIPFHTDCSQSIGKVSVSIKDLSVSMLTIAGHKFYAPKGVGALFIKEGLILHPILYGASHEKGLRPGTENTPYIAGFGKACEIVCDELGAIRKHLKNVTSLLIERLLEFPGIKFNGEEALRIPNTVNISIKGIIGEELVQRLSDRVAISSGSACHAGICKPSHVLLAMGLSPEQALSSVRISTGKFTTEDDVKEASEIIKKEILTLRERS